MVAAPNDPKPVSSGVPLKVNPDAVEGHSAEASQAGGAKAEASIDLGSLMTTPDAMVREQMSQELVNLVKVSHFFLLLSNPRGRKPGLLPLLMPLCLRS